MNKDNDISLSELFKEYDGDYKPCEIDWGEDQGEEVF